jgi:hypothetical protein
MSIVKEEAVFYNGSIKKRKEESYESSKC